MIKELNNSKDNSRNSKLKNYSTPQKGQDTFTKLTDEIKILKQLDVTERVLLATLLRLSNQTGYAFSSDGYLSQDWGISKSKISRGLRKLEDLDLIRRETWFKNNYDNKKQRRIFVNSDKLTALSLIQQRERGAIKAKAKSN